MADFKELLRRYKRTVETLQKLAECAVCLETLKTPFKLCTRGHMMCCSCVETLKACPSCQAEFSIETPVGVKHLLEALPKFCRHSLEGCQDILDNVSDHETYCGYRPEACRDCNSVVPVCELLKHYESKHTQRHLLKTKVEGIEWQIFDPSMNRSDNVPIFLFSNFFWVVMKNDIQEKKLKIMFHVAPTRKPVEDYYVCVRFENKNFSYSYTLKASVRNVMDESKNFKNDKKVNNESKIADNQELYCMTIPTTELKRFIDENNTLTCFMNFFKEDSE